MRAPVAAAGANANRIELVGLAAIVALAAVLRFIDLPARGVWDADQGRDLLVLRNLVLNGEIPLLGPPASMSGFHHGVLFYFVLAPIAALSGADPVVLTSAIALAGTLAVAATWWLARSIGGAIAGLIAGFLMAISASAVEESTFFWNPNLVGLTSSLALAAAWRAWTTRRARWWVVAGAAAVVTMHCHVLGVILTPIIAGLLVADVRRRTGASRRRAVEAGIAWLAVGLLSYVPLAIHELTSGGSEIRAAVAFLTGAGPSDVGFLVRLPIVGLRVLAWPLTGLITVAPIVALVAAAAVIGLTVWRAMVTAGDESSANRDERIAIRWLGLGLVWTIIALAYGASGLATVVLGLPNDHYHGFADPIVFVLVGLGLGGIARAGLGRPQIQMARATAVAALVGAVTIWNVAHQPPAVSPDGGWVAGAAAGDRVLRSLPPGPTEIVSLPIAKGPDAMRFPLVRDGRALPTLVDSSAPPTADAVARIVLCDDLFRAAIGAACGGPAEDPPAASVGLTLVDRFQAAPGRWISVYLPS